MDRPKPGTYRYSRSSDRDGQADRSDRGGPAGIAAAVALLEQGHEVSLFEREDRLGGAPALVYPEDRSPDPTPEIDALLEPAIVAGRLVVILGEDRSPGQLMNTHDAVLLATGCWKESSLRAATGVWPALTFLKAARRRELTRIPERVVILCGGDAAMDAAVTAKALGTKRITLVFEGSRETAHWHLPEAWFETEGVRTLFDTRPVGYDVDEHGAVRGVLMEGGEPADADMVIEAMALVADEVDVISDKVFAAGSLVNGGASLEQCMREGREIAQEIDSFLQGLA